MDELAKPAAALAQVAHGSGTNLDEAPQTTLAPTNGDPMEGMPALTTRATRLCSLLRARQPFLLRWRAQMSQWCYTLQG